jgi:hypothetical protein
MARKPALGKIPTTDNPVLNSFLRTVKSILSINAGERDPDDKLMTRKEIRDRLIAMGVENAERF